jgi:hypothetical protein
VWRVRGSGQGQRERRIRGRRSEGAVEMARASKSARWKRSLPLLQLTSSSLERGERSKLHAGDSGDPRALTRPWAATLAAPPTAHLEEGEGVFAVPQHNLLRVARQVAAHVHQLRAVQHAVPLEALRAGAGGGGPVGGGGEGGWARAWGGLGAGRARAR